jgi:hypothetical protein
MTTLIFLLFACGTPPTVDSVKPDSVPAGATLEVRGENLTDKATVELLPFEGAAIPAESISQAGDHLNVTIPDQLAPGKYGLQVTIDGETATLDKRFEVWRTDKPCDAALKQVMQITQPDQQMAFDRMYNGTERDIIRLSFLDIEQVEYEVIPVDGKSCQVVWVRTVNGRRLVFSDDFETEQKQRAYALGRELGKPVKRITR